MNHARALGRIFKTRVNVKAFQAPTMSSQSTATVGEGAQTEDMPLVVGHDKKKREFYIKLAEGNGTREERAVLQYTWVRDGLIDMYHTGVPPVFRGKGVAKLLAKEAFDYAVSEEAKMQLTCTYLQKYLKDNPLPQYKERAIL